MTLSELFGTELPIVQAPMAGAQDHALAVTVSREANAGLRPNQGRDDSSCAPKRNNVVSSPYAATS